MKRIIVGTLTIFYTFFNANIIYSNDTIWQNISSVTSEFATNMAKNHPYVSSALLVGLYMSARNCFVKNKKEQTESREVTGMKIIIGGCIIDLCANKNNSLPSTFLKSCVKLLQEYSQQTNADFFRKLT